jgi:signal transduction histidine kinase/CheY-like chemotaxis protein
MTLGQAVTVVVNWLALSIATGLIFMLLIQPQRNRYNWWFALVLLALSVWAYFAMARVIPDLSPLDETQNFYMLFMGLAWAPVALYGFVTSLVRPHDGIAGVFLVAGILALNAILVPVWTGHVVRYHETGGTRVEFDLLMTGKAAAVFIGVYLLLSYLYLHISADPMVRPLRLPVALIMIGYAKNLVPALRLPPLSIGLLVTAALLIGHRLLRWQVFNPLRVVNDELRVANNDLLQMSSEVAAARASTGRLEDELRAVSRAKSEFLTNMSHEIRTPLNSIVGYSELLNKGVYGDLNARQQDRVGKIYDNSLNLLALINNVLDLSRIEGGRLELNLDTVRISPLVESMLADLAEDAAHRNLTVQTDIRPPLRVIRADEMRIRQVLANLLSNAIKFTPAGHVKVSARNVTVKDGQSQDFPLPVLGWLPDRAWIILSVEDTGVGIPPEQQATIFEEFHTSGDGLRQQGHGLGLAIARKLVELHTGRIWVQSQIGKGSTFHIALPALEDVEQYEGETVQNVQLEKATAIVLVITASGEIATGLSLTLGHQNYYVVRAHDATSGLARAHEIHPAAILVDVLMPDLAGWDTVRRLKNDPGTASIPLILMTVHDGRATGFRLGACACITKPVQRDELLAAMARVQQTRIEHPVLVVDDDPIERDILREFLHSEDIPIASTESGAAALDWLQQADHLAGMVLLDLVMPHVNGFELLYALRSTTRLAGVPVVLLYPDLEQLSDADFTAMHEFITRVMAGQQNDLLACLTQTLDNNHESK